MAIEKYEIKIDRPEGVSVSQMVWYIAQSVGSWGGSFDPREPLFGHHTVGVRRIKK